MGAEDTTADHLAQNSMSGFDMQEFVKSCNTLNWYGQYKHAMKMAKRGVKEVQEQFGNDGIEYATALHVKASIEQHSTQAKGMLEEVLAIQEAHYGTRHHVEVAITLGNLANAVGDLGDTNHKKQLLEEVLAIKEAHYGTRHHVNVAITLHNFANAVGDLGDTNRQKQLLEEVLAIEEAHYGTRHHVDVAITLHSLANAVGALGDTNRKKQSLEEVLAIEEAHYGCKGTKQCDFRLGSFEHLLSAILALANAVSRTMCLLSSPVIQLFSRRSTHRDSFNLLQTKRQNQRLLSSSLSIQSLRTAAYSRVHIKGGLSLFMPIWTWHELKHVGSYLRRSSPHEPLYSEDSITERFERSRSILRHALPASAFP
jgi:D-lyxose ketol-isomerase